MVKPKHRAPNKKLQNQVDEHDWMLVKKQRITILIPPLPSKAPSTIPNVLCNPRNANSQSSKQSMLLSEKLVAYPSEPNPTFQNPPSSSHRTPSKCSKDIIAATSKGSIRKRMLMFADSSVFLSQRMRASYLERKLEKAGGLENWLTSLGLACFVKVFRMRRVNRFQLANLTMEKLKEMGTVAVGPRRKLMHAIDCLCQPHCFIPL